ncbi:MAG: MMPL family transporter [Deltaproteobacteria bacterium]|nr:MMPL family transporter [Deltaproteobacteria bacterium]
MFSKYINFLYRGKIPLAILFLILFAFSLKTASHLKIRSDFKELLPDNFQSVEDINRIVARVGGTGTLIVAIESDDPQSSIRFGNDLIAKLKEYPPEYIQRIEYNASSLKKFYEDNKYLYINMDDLQEIHDRLDRKIQREKLKGTGLFLDLETEDENTKEFSTKDIEDKYKDKTSKYNDYIDGYFFGENGRLMAIIIQPPGTASGIEFSKKLVEKVNKTIEELNPKQYHASMKTGLTGKFRRVLFEYQTLIDDIVSTAVLCISLVGLAVLIYFQRIRMVLLMAWAVFNGVAWTFAFTEWKIGYLNTQTAFLGSIIIGNGINFGLILMARYLEERKAGKNPLEALHISMPATFPATLASALTTSVAFATLLVTQIKGFSHFGFIGGLGMSLCWVATYTVLPVFLSLSEQIWPVVKLGKKDRLEFSIMKPITKLLPKISTKLLAGGAAFTVLSVILLIFYIPRSLEYDFTKLRVKSKGETVSEEQLLNDRVRRIFPGSMTPAVLVTDRMEQVLPLCDEINRKKNIDSPETQVIDNCKSIYSHIPEDQDKKMALLAQTRNLLEGSSLDFLNKEQKENVEKFKKEFEAKPVTLKDLPEDIIKPFREKNGDVGKIVFVYPTDKAPLWNGKNLIRFADIIRENRLPSGEVITASGDSVIFADILRAVAKDGPKATLLAFFAVCLVVILVFREKRGSLFIIGTLFFGVVWMGGLIALFNFKINFFNFIAIPTTFGIGIDYGVNIYQRYKLEGKGSIEKVLITTGGTVGLCSITTIIGYFTLLIAQNQALVSFGWIAIIGEITCLAVALFFVPALVLRMEK